MMDHRHRLRLHAPAQSRMQSRSERHDLILNIFQKLPYSPTIPPIMLLRIRCTNHANPNSDFAAWVKANEPGTLSYLLLARPASKKSNQLIMFERYDGVKSLGVHGGGKEFKGML
jgi:hypothetical protein